MENKDIQNNEVRIKIIKAAIEEFALNGYKSASTNVICKKAGVSKGLIYYYFKSKEEIYINVLKFALDKFKENVHVDLTTNKRGVEYISEYFEIKFAFFRENPLYSKIIVNSIAYNNLVEAVNQKEEFQRYNNEIIYSIIKNMDIKPKFDREKAFELIMMIGEKLEEKHLKELEKGDNNLAIESFRKDHKLMLEMVFEGLDNK